MEIAFAVLTVLWLLLLAALLLLGRQSRRLLRDYEELLVKQEALRDEIDRLFEVPA